MVASVLPCCRERRPSRSPSPSRWSPPRRSMRDLEVRFASTQQWPWPCRVGSGRRSRSGKCSTVNQLPPWTESAIMNQAQKFPMRWTDCPAENLRGRGRKWPISMPIGATGVLSGLPPQRLNRSSTLAKMTSGRDSNHPRRPPYSLFPSTRKPGFPMLHGWGDEP